MEYWKFSGIDAYKKFRFDVLVSVCKDYINSAYSNTMKTISYLALLSVLVFFSCKKDLVDTSSNQIADVSEETSFESRIETGVSVVFFHASWCSVCEEQRPAVEEASELDELSFASFIEVEYDDSRDLFESQNVDGFPQLLIYKDGVEQERLKGKNHSVYKIKDLVLTYM